MTRTATTRVVAVAAAACSALAFGAPAFADSSQVGVSLTQLGGTRQFSVEDITGKSLSAINLGTGGVDPFRTHVTDSNFTALTQGYTVDATMSNLYLKTASGHDYATKIPSKDVSLAYGSNPLSVLGLSVGDLPKISLSGLLTCANLTSPVQTALGLVAGVVPVTVPDPALTAVCSALDTISKSATPVTATVDGLAQTLSPVISSLTDLPTQLTGAVGGTFSDPDYSAGTVGASDPAKTSTTPTSLRIMTGTAGSTQALLDAVTKALDSALSGSNLLGTNGAVAQTTLNAVIAGLSTSTNTAVATLGSALGALKADQQLTMVQNLVSSILPADLKDLTSLSAQYFGFPILKAVTTDAPVSGTYDGTMTVTFVQDPGSVLSTG